MITDSLPRNGQDNFRLQHHELSVKMVPMVTYGIQLFYDYPPKNNFPPHIITPRTHPHIVFLNLGFQKHAPVVNGSTDCPKSHATHFWHMFCVCHITGHQRVNYNSGAHLSTPDTLEEKDVEHVITQIRSLFLIQM